MKYLLILSMLFIFSSFTKVAEQHTYWQCLAIIEEPTMRWHIGEIVEAKTKQKAKKVFNAFLKKEYPSGILLEGSYWVLEFSPYKDIRK